MNPQDVSKQVPITFTGRRQDGSAYGRQPGRYDETVSKVGPGTPCGELMRRYWHPVGLSSETTDTPQKVRILGENLVLFRDKAGRPGLLLDRCCHRGTTLYYGKVEEQGIRCCYHGWLFAVDGTCVEQPCEPQGGLHRDKARQPWYPVEERYGLVFAYMGPLDQRPPLPKYDTLENLAPAERLEQEGGGFYVGGPATKEHPTVGFSWLQNWENVMDPYHVVILHSRFSGIQFREQLAVMPNVEWAQSDYGIASTQHRSLEDGRTYRRVTQTLLPNVRIVPSIEMTEGKGREVAWLVPVDDHSHRAFGVARVGIDEEPVYTRRSRVPLHNGKRWKEMTEAEHRQYPDDYEAQSGQGSINLHSEETLATTDRGIVMLRRLLTKQIKVVQEGGIPLGAGSLNEPLVVVKAGNFFEESQ